MNTWSRHSVLTDLTQRSAMALARGDLNGVRTWAIPRLHTRRSNVGAITAVAVMNEETSRSSVPRAAFDHLLRRPRGGRMPRHMNIDNLPTGVMDNDRRPRWLDPASSSHRSILSLISSHEFACEVMKYSPAEISCSASDKITNDRLFDVRLVKGAPLAMQAVQPR